jgi:hypothetical protein
MLMLMLMLMMMLMMLVMLVMMVMMLVMMMMNATDQIPHRHCYIHSLATVIGPAVMST